MASGNAFFEPLRTPILLGNDKKESYSKRAARIDEALRWVPGTLAQPLRYDVDRTPSGLGVGFLKPGKEADTTRRRPNPNDMTPEVGGLYEGEQFMDVWVRLAQAGEKDFSAFTAVLALVYRSAFLLDHGRTGEGGLRLRPLPDVTRAIDALDARVGSAIGEGGLWGLLHFLDLLGWNEDVKYHPGGSESLEAKPAMGRQNTLLTCVAVPFETLVFANSVRSHAVGGPEPGFARLYALMQRLLKGRGVCPPTNGQLVEWLSPYVYDTRVRSHASVRRPGSRTLE